MADVETVKVAKYGDRQAVFEGRAEMTKGKLKKGDLMLCEKTGKYKSVKAIERGRSLIQNVRKPVVVPVEEATPEPVVEKPKRQRKKKVPEATD